MEDDVPLPWTMTQHDSRELCFATSSPLSWTACVLLLSRFILSVDVYVLLLFLDGYDVFCLGRWAVLLLGSVV